MPLAMKRSGAVAAGRPPHMHSMKNDHYHYTSRLPAHELVPVNFEFTHPTATNVAIAGTFNNWHPTTKSMQPLGDGRWLKEAYLAPGSYEYCLVVDDRWMPDPRATERVPNPFGGHNSVVKVVQSPEAVRLAFAANSAARINN